MSFDLSFLPKHALTNTPKEQLFFIVSINFPSEFFDHLADPETHSFSKTVVGHQQPLSSIFAAIALALKVKNRDA